MLGGVVVPDDDEVAPQPKHTAINKDSPEPRIHSSTHLCVSSLKSDFDPLTGHRGAEGETVTRLTSAALGRWVAET
jgi:hypothetical protein